MAGRIFPSAEERFWARVHFEPGPLETDCLIWDGYVDAAGYGQFERTSPHRWAYKKYVGPIAIDKELDHLCRRRHCAQWLHLDLVTHRENMERSAPANYTHCRRGHEFTEANTYHYIGKFGPARQCRTCNATRLRQFRARRAQRLSNAGMDTHLGIDGP